jgi:hypothetical protein
MRTADCVKAGINEEVIKKYIKMQGFRFGFPKGLLCVIIKPNLDAW